MAVRHLAFHRAAAEAALRASEQRFTGARRANEQDAVITRSRDFERTLGGALRMNAGAYGREMKDVLTGVNAVTRVGAKQRLVPEDLHMTYRHTDIEAGTIFTGAILKGVKEDYETVRARMNDIKTKRNETQPIREKTGGSTFANPSTQELQRAGLPEGTRAWKVVELVEGRGLKIGGAQMSEMHCNFMINTGGASASDLENLGNEIRKRASEKFGLNLRWEIQMFGEA